VVQRSASLPAASMKIERFSLIASCPMNSDRRRGLSPSSKSLSSSVGWGAVNANVHQSPYHSRAPSGRP